MHLYFVNFEESPLDIGRTVNLQSFSYLANSIICAVLLSLVFQLVQELDVCKWSWHFPAVLLVPFKIGGGQYMFNVFSSFLHFSPKLFVPKLYAVKLYSFPVPPPLLCSC